MPSGPIAQITPKQRRRVWIAEMGAADGGGPGSNTPDP
jgi:hypothetical protein